MKNELKKIMIGEVLNILYLENDEVLLWLEMELVGKDLVVDIIERDEVEIMDVILDEMVDFLVDSSKWMIDIRSK